jgi:poly(3-hydroxybutyrate) depolymerase
LAPSGVGTIFGVMLNSMRLALILFLALGTLALGAEPGAKEKGLRGKTADQVLAFATWCAANAASDAGTAAIAEARGLTDEDTVADAETALDGVANGAADAALTKARRVFGPKVAKAYDKLVALSHDDADQKRFDEYRLAALRWDQSSARAKKAASWVKGEDNQGRAARLLARARSAAGGASGPLDSLVKKAAKKGPLLLGSATQPLVGWVWLPRSWKKGKTYPVLIGVDGAGSNHKGYGAASASARGSRDVIVLAPITLSNTNALLPKKYPFYDQAVLDAFSAKRMDFDGPGVDALLAEIATLFGGEDRVFLTGFSGGGQFTYFKLLQDPEHVRGAVPCCANFGGNGRNGAPGAGDDGGPPVLILTGDADPHREFTRGDKSSPGIEPQTDLAMKTLEGLGYKHVERRMVKAKHSPLHPMVWEFVDSVLSAE